MENTFWMVKRENDTMKYSTAKMHQTEQEARYEAVRLVKQEKARFWVLKAISYCEPKEEPIRWVEMSENNQR